MKQYIYAIMPLSADSEFQKKRDIFVSVAKQYNFNIHFPFEVSSKDKNDVIEDLRSAAIVFADLSFERPSCYFELGLAQALNLPTYLVASEGTILHQVHGQVQFYKNLHDYGELVKGALKKGMPNIVV